jgi:hypothetical protein
MANTITATCVRCHVEFTRECSDADADLPPCMPFQETDPVCDDCEHTFLSWTTCHPVM